MKKNLSSALCGWRCLWLAFALGLPVPGRGQSTAFTYDSAGSLVARTALSPGMPTIIAQPASQVLSADGTASFTVSASGAGPLTYQWLSNGVPIAGATSDTLTITNVIVPRSVLTNGSFETPAVVVSYVTHLAGDSLGGWYAETGTVDHVFTFWLAAEGFQSIDLNGTSAGAIYQDVPTTPGQQYFLRYALAGNIAAAPVTKTNSVWWNGTALATNIFTVTGHTYDDLGWTNYEYTVTATSNLTRLKFATLVTGAAGPALDNVSLIPVTPPPVSYSVIVSNSSDSVTSTVATIQFDTDHNGLPDAWERTYFAGTGQSPEADSDGDGVSNGDEYLEGTNPANPASFRPRLNFFVRPGGVVLRTPFKPSYALSESVQITAPADPGNFFLGWIGGITNTNATVNLTMDGTKNITALFGFGLTSGAAHEGTLTANDTNTYAFNGSSGDRIILRVGELLDGGGFDPKVQLFNPAGVLLGSASAAVAAELTATLTNSGVFVVVISDGPSGGTAGSGDYRLHFARLPGAFVVSPGDEGGELVNGGNAYGTISAGDLDLWSFTASPGESIVLRVGQLTDNNGDFDPWIRLYSPTGVLLDSQFALAAAEIALTATNGGTFTVVVSDAGVSNPYLFSDTGNYRLHLVKSPGAFVVPAGDEGGALANGASSTGTIDVGDLDPWSFTANAGDNVVVRVGQVTDGNGDFDPWIRLYGPNGALIGSAYGYAAAEIAATVTNSGTCAIVVGDIGYSNPYYISDTGTYQVYLARSPGAFVVPAGDEGGELINGTNQPGTIDVGDLDLWSFPASAGDNIVLRVAELTDNGDFDPWIRLYSPAGVLLGSSYGFTAAEIAVRATNNGTFIVVVGDIGYSSPYYVSDTGTYQLRLAKAPGAFVVPAGDEGGQLVNGANNPGTIDAGDLDLWSFAADAGDNIVLRVSQVTDGNGDFDPGIRLYGPTGVLLGEASGFTAAEIAVRATNGGTFTVVVGDDNLSNPYYVSDTGTYRLYLAKAPGAFVVGDEGAILAPAGVYYGTNDFGDLDLWGFWANKGDNISVLMEQLTDPLGDYDPWIRLYGPSGILLNSTATAASSLITRLATNSGPYLVVAGDGAVSNPYYLSDAGTYRLTLGGMTGPVQFTNTVIAGSQLILSGATGPTNTQYVLLASTNIAAPVASWTPVQTNLFNSAGQFVSTNNLTPGDSSRFFRLRFL